MDIANIYHSTLNEMEWWSWIALIYLFFISFRAINTGGICIRTLATIPFAFIISRHHILFKFYSLTWKVYIVSVLLFTILGYFITNEKNITYNTEEKTIQIPGSYDIMIATLLHFTVKYPLGYFMNFVHSSLPVSCPYRDSILIGIFVGYFLGKLVFYYLHNKKVSDE